MWKTALTSRELYHDLNGKKEIRGIGWFKNSLIGYMVIEGLEKNTPSIKVYVKSFKIIMRSYNEIFQNLRVILCFCSSLDSLCFLYCSLPFALFFLHLFFCTYLFHPRWPTLLPKNLLAAKFTSFKFLLKTYFIGEFSLFIQARCLSCSEYFSISFLLCLKANISGSQGLSVIFFLETEWEFLTNSLFWLK